VLRNIKEHEDDDIHGVNLIIKREVFEKVSGFQETYQYTSGEDTIFCLRVKKAGYKIIFSPNVVVYHHRRTIFFDHFKQIANYAFHRGFFVRKFPENSFKLKFFLPSLFLLGVLLGGLISLFSNIVLKMYISVLCIYFLVAFVSSLRLNLISTILTTLGIFFSHLTYGFYFLKGLLTKEYKEEDKYYERMILSQKRFQR
ncbi:MAG: glycosyltransferase, partial [Brevinematia bacterium]